jgi:hypothetical protein
MATTAPPSQSSALQRAASLSQATAAAYTPSGSRTANVSGRHLNDAEHNHTVLRPHVHDSKGTQLAEVEISIPGSGDI